MITFCVIARGRISVGTIKVAEKSGAVFSTTRGSEIEGIWRQ
jgi:hypothetical protein